jgi:hypothetical protein
MADTSKRRVIIQCHQGAKISPHDSTNQEKKTFHEGQMNKKYCEIESANTVASKEETHLLFFGT